MDFISITLTRGDDAGRTQTQTLNITRISWISGGLAAKLRNVKPVCSVNPLARNLLRNLLRGAEVVEVVVRCCCSVQGCKVIWGEKVSIFYIFLYISECKFAIYYCCGTGKQNKFAALVVWCWLGCCESLAVFYLYGFEHCGLFWTCNFTCLCFLPRGARYRSYLSKFRDSAMIWFNEFEECIF